MLDILEAVSILIETPQEKSIREFIKTLNKDVKVQFVFDENAGSDMINKIIYFDLYDYYYKLKNEKIILDYISKHYNFENLSLPTIMLLHELGHIETAKNYVNLKGLLRQYSYKVSKIENSNFTIRKKIKLYNNLKLEKDAFVKAEKIFNKNKCLIKAFDHFMIN